MANGLQGLLASLLNPNPGAGGLLSDAGYLQSTGLGPQQMQRYQAMSGMGGAAPAMPPAPPQGAQQAPQAPMQPDMTQTASTRPSGGGIGDFLGNLLAPKAAQRNKTVQLLMQDGLDEGTATLYAGNKQALQQYLMQRTQPQKRDTVVVDGKLVDAQSGQVIGNYGDDGLLSPEEEAQKIRLAQAGAARSIGTPPVGYQIQYDGNGNPVGMTPIPGGPAALEAEQAKKKDDLAAGQADVATRVVTSAAQRAREAAKNRNLGHVGQGIASAIPWTDSAEVARQVDVLKSTAKVENLTAMRQASPTGGALGSVTEKEADMLAAKSGALDPSSPTFQRDLDDYELTLLQVVHGPEEGSRIFSQTRSGAAPATTATQPTAAASGDRQIKSIKDLSDEELEAIINGN